MAPVLIDLRTHFTPHTLIAHIKEQQKYGYLIAFAESDDEIVGVAGLVIGSKLTWGKHMYVDDLVTRERSRSRSAGGALIAWLKAYARTEGCGQVHLDSGVQGFAAHRFYLRHGFDITSHDLSMKGIAEVPRGSA